jgi:hypothetical protein
MLDLTPWNAANAVLLPFHSWSLGNGTDKYSGDLPNSRGAAGYTLSGYSSGQGFLKNGTDGYLQATSGGNVSTPVGHDASNNFNMGAAWCFDWWIDVQLQGDTQVLYSCNDGTHSIFVGLLTNGGIFMNRDGSTACSAGINLLSNGRYHLRIQHNSDGNYHVYINGKESTGYNSAYSGGNVMNGTSGIAMGYSTAGTKYKLFAFAPQSFTQAQTTQFFLTTSNLGQSANNSGNALSFSAISTLDLTPWNNANSQILPFSAWSTLEGGNGADQYTGVMPNYPNGSSLDVMNSFTAGQGYINSKAFCEFDPNGGTITTPVDLSLPGTGFYADAWIIHHAGGSQSLWNAYEDATRNDYIFISGGSYNQIACNVGNVGIFTTDQSLVEGAFYHVAVVWNPTTKYFRPYVNGVPCTFSFPPYTFNNQYTGSVTIDPGNCSVGYGAIFELLNWTFAKGYVATDAQVMAIYNAGPTMGGYKASNSGNLMSMIGGATPLTGTIATPISISGTLSTTASLTGTITMPLTIAGTLSTTASLTGTIAIPISISGTLTEKDQLSGTIATPITFSGTLTATSGGGGATSGGNGTAGMALVNGFALTL